MDAAALGGAMVAMARLVEHSTALLYGAATPVKVDIAADFEAGSFSFEVLTVVGDVSGLGKQLLDSVKIEHVLGAIGVTGSGGLIALVRWLARRKVAQVSPVAGTKNVVVTTDGGDSTIVHADTVNLFQNSSVRFDLNGVVAPLEREGITEFRAGSGSVASATVRQDEIGFFEPPPPTGETLLDRDSEEIVQIVGTYFRPGRKWMFALPDGTSFTSVLDPAYAKRVVPGGDRYGAGDAFRVTLHTVVVRTSDGRFHAKREIVKVIQLIPATTQLSLLPDSDRNP